MNIYLDRSALFIFSNSFVHVQLAEMINLVLLIYYKITTTSPSFLSFLTSSCLHRGCRLQPSTLLPGWAKPVDEDNCWLDHACCNQSSRKSICLTTNTYLSQSGIFTKVLFMGTLNISDDYRQGKVQQQFQCLDAK